MCFLSVVGFIALFLVFIWFLIRLHDRSKRITEALKALEAMGCEWHTYMSVAYYIVPDHLRPPQKKK